MAKNGLREQVVQCPFYHSDDGRGKITCEGIVEGSSLSLNYGKKQDLLRQMEVFCCEHYRKCEIYRMLMEKYA